MKVGLGLVGCGIMGDALAQATVATGKSLSIAGIHVAPDTAVPRPAFSAALREGPGCRSEIRNISPPFPPP